MVDGAGAGWGDGEEDSVRGYVAEEEAAEFCSVGCAGQRDSAGGGEAERVRDGGGAALTGAVGGGGGGSAEWYEIEKQQEEEEEEERPIVLRWVHD